MSRESELIDRFRKLLRLRHYAVETERSYVSWVQRFLRYHGGQDPSLMGKAEVEQFLAHLAEEVEVAASTQNQALSALLLFYSKALRLKLPWLDQLVHAKRVKRVPVVLTRSEVDAIFRQLNPPYLLVAQLLYGSGMRLNECLKLRRKDLNFEPYEIAVQDPKGRQARVTLLPQTLVADLQRHLRQAKRLHPKATRPPRRQHHHDLHPRAQPGWQGSTESQ